MCLDQIKGPFIAEEDVVCYKVLKQKDPNYIPYIKEVLGENISGDFTAKIKNKDCKGKIFKSFDGNYYLFQDVVNGDKPNEFDNLHENYQYSWWLDDNVFDLCINNIPFSVDKKEFETIYFRQLIKPGMLCESNIDVRRDTLIEKALHSFITKENAKCELTRKNRILIKCIIPKGSTYYCGKYYATEDDSYASNMLQYPDSFE